MISNLRSDIEFRREKALELSIQVRRHIAAGGKYSIGDSPEINPDPAKRSEIIAPTTILKRRKPPIPRAERDALRKLAEAL